MLKLTKDTCRKPTGDTTFADGVVNHLPLTCAEEEQAHAQHCLARQVLASTVRETREREWKGGRERVKKRKGLYK